MLILPRGGGDPARLCCESAAAVNLLCGLRGGIGQQKAPRLLRFGGAGQSDVTGSCSSRWDGMNELDAVPGGWLQ
jgi:hypothetical protein